MFTSAPPRRGRRPIAALLSSALVASGVAGFTLATAGVAHAAVLGKVTVSPASGTDSTLFGGSVTASCPSGTGDSYWSIDGPDLPRDQAILAPGNATGTGAQSFTGASLANIKSANSGSFSADGTYVVRFNCVATSNGAVTDTYERTMAYTVASGGSYLMAADAPGAPTGVTATAGDFGANVSWTAPASNGGAAITSYTATASPGGVTCSAAVTNCALTGLTNGTAYTVTVTATNSAGTGAASSPSASFTPVGPSTAPVIGSATAGNAQASVTFTAPSNNGGSAITSYTVTSTPGGLTGTGSSSPIVVTGLTNGTAYTFAVTATNSSGTSAASAASNSVTPSTTPSAPAKPTATAGSTSASVAITAPANGGSAITSYTVTASPGGATASGATSPIVVGGLTNGTAYTFTVTATNANGTSTSSPASDAVTPASAPGAPTGVTATSGDTTSDVAWTAPASNGGSAITGYTVTATPSSGTTVTKTVAGTSTTLTGLVNGTTYSVTVVATNAVASSPASSAATINPAGVPFAPAKPTVTAGNEQVSVAFAAPSNNGSAITSYTVTAAPGGATATGSGSPLVVTGLTNGTAYTFTVTATNARGTSAASPASDAITPGVKTATTTALATTQRDVLAGRLIALRGQVTGVTGATSVVLRATYRSGSVDTTYSAPDGNFAVDLRATQNVTFRLLYLGDSSHNASVSGTTRTIVHGRLAIGTVTRGADSVTITGLIRPSVAGQSAVLYEVINGRVVGLQRVVTGANGRFSVTQAASSGRHVYRLVGAATPVTGVTNTVQVIVTLA